MKNQETHLFGRNSPPPNELPLWNLFVGSITPPGMALNQDFKEFLELLNKHEVKYLVVGGYSVAIHGHPRYTKDIDIWILTDPDNAKALLDALDEFGFGSLDLSVEDFETPGQVVQLGNAPARIDILTSLTGVDFDVCWENKITVKDEGLAYPVISLSDLRVNKRALGRHQDLADLEELGDD
ncbi:MAG: nucleotidyltransferase [Kordiimonadaceae bacterium]|nr:nucleotidyltransferase [Kordiimonadaceae bacterium]